MGETIQLRDVPDSLYRELRTRAARAGMSLSDYARRILERSLRRVTPEEMRRRLSEREPVDPNEPAAAAVRTERDSRRP